MPKRLRRPRDYQRRDDPVRLIADANRPAIRREIKQALDHLGDLVPVQLATRLIEHGLYWRVKEVIPFDHFREVLKAPFDRIAQTREQAAAYGTRKINAAFSGAGRRVRFGRPHHHILRKHGVVVELGAARQADDVAKDVGDRFNFDRFEQQTLARIRRAQDRMIKGLADDARDAVDSIIVSSLRAGESPAQVVADIRGMIGLTDTQAQAVINYRAALEDGNASNALARALRVTSADDEVRAGNLSQDRIDELVDQYEENYLWYRAETIAQTESTRGANAGLQDAYRQAIERGALPDGAVRQYWRVSLKENTCPICLSIPDLNPDGVGINEQFESIDGPQEAPPDPHPNCACSVEIVTDLDQLGDEETI